LYDVCVVYEVLVLDTYMQFVGKKLWLDLGLDLGIEVDLGFEVVGRTHAISLSIINA
jgi:hypothetical protein